MVPTSKNVTFFPILELCVPSKFKISFSQITNHLFTSMRGHKCFFCSQILYKKFIDFYYIAFFYIFSIKASLELHFGWNSFSMYGDASTNIFQTKIISCKKKCSMQSLKNYFNFIHKFHEICFAYYPRYMRLLLFQRIWKRSFLPIFIKAKSNFRRSFLNKCSCSKKLKNSSSLYHAHFIFLKENMFDEKKV